MAHRVKGEKVVLTDAVCLPEELEPRFEDARLGVLEWHADAQHGAPVVMVEIDSFRHLAPRDTQ